MEAPIIFMILAGLVAIPLGIVAVLYLIVPFFKAIGWVVRQVFTFIGGEISDLLRIVGALVTQLVLAPLVVASILIGRWSAASHYGRALSAECKTAGLAFYRVLIGHPARLLCLTSLVDGIERRVPEVVAAAPTADKPSGGRSGQFDGYKIVGSLPGGGSGGKLYIAEPDTIKRAIFERAGQRDVRQVVIKTFSLRDGSSLPQIVRESRALDAAKRLGLVLEHELSNERFFYVTRYVPGESLGLVTQRLHAMSGGDGLGVSQLKTALGYSADLLRTLDGYHRGGLWHKDVKPDNIIVDAHSAHLVDFGLVTPLRSAMTLTTHGTEYFRDPELVRMALKGVKVHEVDGAKFDVYAASAVLFSMIENSFPAHGGLSQITRKCPEALRWVVRRGMTEYDKRYATASAMLRDVEYIAASADPFAVKPFELPSMGGADVADETVYADSLRPEPEQVKVGAGSDEPARVGGFAGVAAGAVGAAAAAASTPPHRVRPRLKVKNWWSGGYVTEAAAAAPAPDAPGMKKVFPGVYVSGNLGEALQGLKGLEGLKGLRGLKGLEGIEPAVESVRREPRPVRVRHAGSAKEQLERARARADAARARARDRVKGARHQRYAKGDFKPFNGGVVVALLLFAGLLGLFMLSFTTRKPMHVVVNQYGDSEQNIPGSTFAEGDLMPVSANVERTVQTSHASIGGVDIKVSNTSKPSPRVVVNERGDVIGTIDPQRQSMDLLAPEDLAALENRVGIGKRVLVMSEIQPPSETITVAIDGLRSLGFTVMGNYPGNTSGEEEMHRQMDLDSEVKFVRGLGQLRSEEVMHDLGDWLEESDSADAIVWFSRGDEKDWVRYHVYTPTTDPSDHGLLGKRIALRTAIQQGLTASNAAGSGH